ncbi:MAG: hypothetical protein ASARMPREDX12_000195 [Alectoria sarmentosa]|nr:MAG: hypothetical protein ASARMPREDX12_000195 [Alectoria sarmentosa]
MHPSTLISLLPLLAVLTVAAPVIKGTIAPLAERAEGNSTSVYTVKKRRDADTASKYDSIDTRKRSDADSASIYAVDKRNDADNASIYTVE